MQCKQHNIKRIHFLNCISTQVIARYIDTTNILITSDYQKNGEGKADRVWHSNTGNMFGTYIINNIDKVSVQYLYIYFAITVYELLKKLNIVAKIKLPNDIMVNGAKISGILVENFGHKIIIGIGINIKKSFNIDQKIICIQEVLQDMTNTDYLWDELSYNVEKMIYMININDINNFMKNYNDIIYKKE